ASAERRYSVHQHRRSWRARTGRFGVPPVLSPPEKLRTSVSIRVALRDCFRNRRADCRPRRRAWRPHYRTRLGLKDPSIAVIQGGKGVDIEIHAESVARLIGHELGIDAGLTGETGMGAAHDLKCGPAELDRIQRWRNEPSPGVVAAEWRGPLCRRKDPCVGIRRPRLLPPFSDPVPCHRGYRDVSCRAFANILTAPPQHGK